MLPSENKVISIIYFIILLFYFHLLFPAFPVGNFSLERFTVSCDTYVFRSGFISLKWLFIFVHFRSLLFPIHFIHQRQVRRTGTSGFCTHGHQTWFPHQCDSCSSVFWPLSGFKRQRSLFWHRFLVSYLAYSENSLHCV